MLRKVTVVINPSLDTISLLKTCFQLHTRMHAKVTTTDFTADEYKLASVYEETVLQFDENVEGEFVEEKELGFQTYLKLFTGTIGILR